MEIKVKYVNEDTVRLTKISQGDWIDLSLDEDIDLMQGESGLYSLGVCIELPQGYEAILAPRSSTFKHYGLLQTNSIGIIDNSYCGDNDIWKVSFYATKNTFVPKGTRICQFRIIKNQPSIEFTEVEHLGNADRNGFGSTGR